MKELDNPHGSIRKNSENEREGNFTRPLKSSAEAEVYDVALKIKRKSLLEKGEMGTIQKGSENFFRDKLGNLSPRLLDLYLALKTGLVPEESVDSLWEEINSFIPEQAIKEEYINSALRIENGRDDLYLELASKQIEKQKRERRFDQLVRRAKRKGIENPENALFTILEFEGRANQILYPDTFSDYVLESEKDPKDHLEIAYYVCLRFGQNGGHLDISSDLLPFSFVDINGQSQKRNGLSKLFQLETIKNLQEKTKDLQSISHTIIIPDFDLFKYEGEGTPLLPKAEEYRKSVADYLNNLIPVVGEIEYYQRMGFDENDYEDIRRSIYLNDGQFVPTLDVVLDLARNQKKGERIIGHWSSEANRTYTSRSLARSYCEGKVLSQHSQYHTCCVFDHQVKIGEQFNRSSKQKKNPFIALPIFSDNIGGIEFA